MAVEVTRRELSAADLRQAAALKPSQIGVVDEQNASHRLDAWTLAAHLWPSRAAYQGPPEP